MGYYAPSVDKIYRYILRLDRERSLTDRFSWSLLLVNDNSRVCEDFLKKYCVDLCMRTADRIRFIFFSNIPEGEMQKIANKLNDGSLKGKGFLNAVLDNLFLSFAYRSDYGENPWSRLRPDAFYPMQGKDEIEKRISWECDLNTAMPGYGKAMEFAQRLGIGRYVPCILIFTDIGRLQIDILPISKMNPEQVFNKLRIWVDAFYSLNQPLLEKWRGVEENIINFCSESRNSLYRVSEWRNKHFDDWSRLKKISKGIRILTGDLPSGWLAVAFLQNDYGFSRDWRNMVGNFINTMEHYDRRMETRKKLIHYKEQLALLDKSEEISSFLAFLSDEFKNVLSIRIPDLLKKALSHIGTQSQIILPADELKRWWKHRRDLSLSCRQFCLYRKSWMEFSKARNPNFDNKKMTDIIHEEYQVAYETSSNIPLAGDPCEAANRVLNNLADYYGVNHKDPLWITSTENYKEYLVKYFKSFQLSAPKWLIDGIPGLTLRECMPNSNWNGTFDEFIKANPALGRIINADADPQKLMEIKNQKQIELHYEYRDLLVEKLLMLADQLSPSVNDCYSAREGLLDYFVSEQTRTQKEILDNRLKSTSGKFPGKELDRESADRLFKELDAYEKTVKLVRYPHLDDPDIISVPIMKPIIDIIDISGTEQKRELKDQELRDSITRVMVEAQKSMEEWPSVQRESLRQNPLSALYSGLVKVIGTERLHTLTKSHNEEEAFDRLEFIVRHNMTRSLLDSLKRAELIELKKEISNGNEKNRDDDKKIVNDLCDDIMENLGLLTIKERYLSTVKNLKIKEKCERILIDKMARDDFDVFIAHNSLDKPAVLEICERLRAEGIYPWIDIEQIPPGRWFQDILQSVIRKVKSAAVFIGSYGIGKWQVLEIRSFISQCIERELPVIPVLLPNMHRFPDELIFLNELNYVKFESGLDDPSAINKLIWGITGIKPD